MGEFIEVNIKMSNVHGSSRYEGACDLNDALELCGNALKACGFHFKGKLTIEEDEE